jgi:mRNA-degrading endonuclease YafQ of YafQ-DinJ toxin-antitoxin module
VNKQQLLAGKAFESELHSNFKNMFKASFREDVEDKVDLKQVVTYQCKSLGKILREHPLKAEYFKWVEIYNVHGDGGTMLSEVDYIVYELTDYYLVISKNELFNFLKGRIKHREPLKRSEIESALSESTLSEVCYRPYTRKGRQDSLILIPTLDLLYCGGSLISRT